MVNSKLFLLATFVYKVLMIRFSKFQFFFETRLNMVFIPTLPVKAEFNAIMLTNAGNVEPC